MPAIVFSLEIDSGCYPEYNSADNCQRHGPQAPRLRVVVPGDLSALVAGANEVRFERGVSAGASPRANVTVMSYGDQRN